MTEDDRQRPRPDPEVLNIEEGPEKALGRLHGKPEPVVVLHDRPGEEHFTPRQVAHFESEEKARDWIQEEWTREEYSCERDLLSIFPRDRTSSPLAVFRSYWE